MTTEAMKDDVRAAERTAIVAWLRLEHDRMMNMAGWLRDGTGSWKVVRNGPSSETHNDYVGRANAIFAVRAGIEHGAHLKSQEPTP